MSWSPALLATTLVLAGSAAHACWNAMVKLSPCSGVAFVWLYSALLAPLWLAVLAGLLAGPGLGPAWWTALVSMGLHTAYAVVLQKSYAAADLTLVYPVSRGLSPVLVSLAALPWAPAFTGCQVWALPVVAGGALLAGGVSRKALRSGRGLAGGVLVAACTAAYTLWDAYAMGRLHVALGPYLATSSTAQVVLLTVLLRARLGELRDTVAAHWHHALPIAVLAPVSYALVLLAMRVGGPGVVATARCSTVVFGAIVGALLLRERVGRRRLLGICAIALGALMTAL